MKQKKKSPKFVTRDVTGYVGLMITKGRTNMIRTSYCIRLSILSFTYILIHQYRILMQETKTPKLELLDDAEVVYEKSRQSCPQQYDE